MVATQPSWEEVLASFEASAEHAETLLGADATSPPDLAPPVIAYDPWQLGMPQLPERLRGRAELLRQRQRRLAEEMQTAMTSVRRQEQLIADSGSTDRSSVYVDRRI